MPSITPTTVPPTRPIVPPATVPPPGSTAVPTPAPAICPCNPRNPTDAGIVTREYAAPF